MKRKPKYKVKIYDEAHLVEKGGFSLTRFRIIVASLVLMVVFLGISIALVCFTPLKNILPGYMKAEQRVKTEDAYLRVDSLEDLYTIHQAYLDNIVKVLDTNREPDVPDTVGMALPLMLDSLMVSSEIEKEFMKKMEEAGYIITINEDYEEREGDPS